MALSPQALLPSPTIPIITDACSVLLVKPTVHKACHHLIFLQLHKAIFKLLLKMHIQGSIRQLIICKMIN